MTALMPPDSKTPDLQGFILQHKIAALATVGEKWPIQIATIYYATSDGLTLYAKFQTTSDHGQAISKDNCVALSIHDPESTYHKKTGIQLRGHCTRVVDEAELRDAIDLYSSTFDGARERFDPVDILLSDKVKSTLYRINVVSGKMVTLEGHMSEYKDMP